MRLFIVPASAAAVLVAISSSPSRQHNNNQLARIRSGRPRPAAPRTRSAVPVAMVPISQDPATTGAHWSQLQWRVGRAADHRALPARDGDDAPAGAGIARRRDDAQRHRVLIQRAGGGSGAQDLTIKTAMTMNAAASSRGSGPPRWRSAPAPEADRVAEVPLACAGSPSEAK